MNVVFCALARDCLKRLRVHQKTFAVWEAAFPTSRWVFVENDSRDATRAWLENWARRNPRVNVIGANTGERTIPLETQSGAIPGYSLYRISRMAMFRNRYLDWVAQEIGWRHVDFLVVFDVDVCSLPAKQVIERLQSPARKAAFTAFGEHWKNGIDRVFHDAYAYRPANENTPLTLEMIKNRRARLSCEIRQWEAPREVRSNFNGLGIYPVVEGMETCRYAPISNSNPQIEAECEHVAFHDGLSKLGIRILLDPALRVSYNHWFTASTARLRTFSRLWKRKLR